MSGCNAQSTCSHPDPTASAARYHNSVSQHWSGNSNLDQELWGSHRVGNRQKHGVVLVSGDSNGG